MVRTATEAAIRMINRKNMATNVLLIIAILLPAYA
jgi:hypothetical protein